MVPYEVGGCRVYHPMFDLSKGKIKNKKLVGLVQPLEVPKWKWDIIYIDFVVIVSKTHNIFDSIKVIVDHLTNSVVFIPIKNI